MAGLKGHIKFKESLADEMKPSSSPNSFTVQRSEGSYAMKMLQESSEGGNAAPRNIFEAAERGMTGWIVKAVERSLEFDINQRDKLQRTALHWAAEMGRIEAAEALMDYGVDVAAQECNGRTAIHLAAREGHADMLRTMMAELPDDQKEALANQRDLYGITPVYLSLQKGEDSRPAFEYLMECGGRYNQQSNSSHARDPVPPATEQAAKS
uniref:Uncharacterized protein n=1 Tax=Chlamydomonas leiostraca TaxID=1034604 RepID=A0A7S0S0X3_9CHLO|mmetsp:Transcript_35474/g.89768  ORF Transcript_35474/g.89768 Transcript_35474/m.89768 type:complete len:210 (+) Transcript_35474:111-740(+)